MDAPQGGAAEKTGRRREAAGRRAGGHRRSTPAISSDRTVAVPGVEAGNYFRLEATADGFLYLAQPEPHFKKYQTRSPTTRAASWTSITSCSTPEKPGDWKAEKRISGIANYHLSGDGKQLVYRAGGAYGVLDAGKEGKPGDGEVSLAAVKVKIDRRAEYLPDLRRGLARRSATGSTTRHARARLGGDPGRVPQVRAPTAAPAATSSTSSGR